MKEGVKPESLDLVVKSPSWVLGGLIKSLFRKYQGLSLAIIHKAVI